MSAERVDSRNGFRSGRWDTRVGTIDLAISKLATLIRSIFDQPDAEQVHSSIPGVVDQLTERFADAADMLVGAEADILPFSGFPKEHWRPTSSASSPSLTSVRTTTEDRCGGCHTPRVRTSPQQAEAFTGSRERIAPKQRHKMGRISHGITLSLLPDSQGHGELRNRGTTIRQPFPPRS